MRLTFDKIIENFNLNVIDSHLNSEQKLQLLVDVKLIVKDQSKFKTTTIYVGTSDFITKNKIDINQANIVIICDDQNLDIVDNISDSAYILLDDENDLFDVFNRINEIFTYELKLATLRNHNNLYHIAENTSEYMKNPVIIIDKNFRIRAHSDLNGLTDKVWNENVSKGFCSYEFIAFVKEMREMNESLNNSTPFHLNCSMSSFQRWVSKIYLHGRLMGYILVIIENDILEDEQKRILSDISKIVSTWFELNSEEYNISDSGHKHLLLDLLDNRINNSNILNEKIKIYHESFKKQFIVIVFGLKDASYQDFSKGSIAKEITTIFNRRHIFYDEDIVLLYDFNSETFTASNKLKDFIAKSNISIGISSSFDDLTKFRKHYIEAKKALWIKEDLHLSEQIINYKDVGFYAFLRDFSGKTVDLEAYIHPTLDVLNRYDTENGTNFYETLYVYLKNQHNTVATGNELFIHRNTVKYRIDKIVKLTNIDFSNEYEVFNIIFSYVVKTWDNTVVKENF